MSELEEKALFEYYNAKAAGEKSAAAIAVLFPDGTILSAATLTIHPATMGQGKPLRLTAEQNLKDKTIVHFGKHAPVPVARVEIQVNHHHPDQFLINYR